jgi:hypothetical protein
MENEQDIIVLLTKVAEAVAELLDARVAFVPQEYVVPTRAKAQELRTLSKAILQPSQPSQGSK